MKAAKTLIRDFGEIEKLQVSEKGPGDFVTASDKRVEKIIIDELKKTEYSFLTEETGKIDGKQSKQTEVCRILGQKRNGLSESCGSCI